MIVDLDKWCRYAGGRPTIGVNALHLCSRIMLLCVQRMMVTTLVILVLLALTSVGAVEDDFHSPRHRHHYKHDLHHQQDKHQQRFDDKPQSGSNVPEYFLRKQLIPNTGNPIKKNSSHEATYHHAKPNPEGGLHPYKKFNDAKYHGEISTTKYDNEETSSEPIGSPQEEPNLPEEDKLFSSQGKIVSSEHKRDKMANRTHSNVVENVENVGSIREKPRTSATLTNTNHEVSSDSRSATKGTITSDLEGTPCSSDADCYLLNYNDTNAYHSNVVHAPYCQVSDNNSMDGYCTCGNYCVSHSKDSKDDHLFYYCGPCGRMGSSCSYSVPCNHTLSTCTSGYCTCESGEFYNLYYCMIPYYGYEKALQVAIATCIFVAVCLLAATIYSSLYRRPQGRIHPYILRLLMRRANQGTRESPPGDTPPKYDDVVEEPPSYQQALELEKDKDGQGGEENHGFEGENDENNKNTNDNSDGDGSGGGGGGILNTTNTNTNNNIRKDSRVSNDGIAITVVATKSSSNDNKSSDGDNNDNNSISNQDDDIVPDEYARHVARHTGAIPKQKSLAKIKKTKRTGRNTENAVPAGDGVVIDVSVGNGDDSSVVRDRRDSCGADCVDSEGMEALADQPITIPLRMQKTSLISTQF